MALIVSVVPAGEGWAIRSDVLDADLQFEQGGRAEAAARALADRYAQSGRSAEVRIFLRDRTLAGRFAHPAAATSEAMAG